MVSSIVITVVILLFTAVILIGTAAGMFFLFKTMAKAQQDKAQLLANGVPAQARIVSANQTGMFVNNNPQVAFQLEVQPQAGSPYPVQMTSVVQMVALPRIQPGMTVGVKIDPNNPNRLAIEGL